MKKSESYKLRRLLGFQIGCVELHIQELQGSITLKCKQVNHLPVTGQELVQVGSL